MTNRTSLTGGVVLDLQYRETWPDQIDDFAEDCPICQQEGGQIECNVYLSFEDGGRHIMGACLCCVLEAALIHITQLDRNRPVIVEFASGRAKS